jgi:hypothetical protein
LRTQQLKLKSFSNLFLFSVKALPLHKYSKNYSLKIYNDFRNENQKENKIIILAANHTYNYGAKLKMISSRQSYDETRVYFAVILVRNR